MSMKLSQFVTLADGLPTGVGALVVAGIIYAVFSSWTSWTKFKSERLAKLQKFGSNPTCAVCLLPIGSGGFCIETTQLRDGGYSDRLLCEKCAKAAGIARRSAEFEDAG